MSGTREDPWQLTTPSADESKPAADGTVEAWARSGDNPVGGVEVEHKARGTACARLTALPPVRPVKTGPAGRPPPAPRYRRRALS